MAAREGDLEILKILLNKSPKAYKSRSKNGRSPLHTACLSGNLEVVQLILEIDLNEIASRDSCGATPLMEAVRGGHASLVNYLASTSPQSVHLVDAMRRNSLHLAAESGHDHLVRILLASDLRINEGPITPLHWAAKEGHAQTIKTLIELGADPHSKDCGHRVPLALAIGGQHVEASLVLLKHSQNLMDLKLLDLAKSSAMKKSLQLFFKTQWNLILYLPGTD